MISVAIDAKGRPFTISSVVLTAAVTAGSSTAAGGAAMAIFLALVTTQWIGDILLDVVLLEKHPYF